MSELAHRLQKNHRRLAASFRAQNVEAWRLYAQDIPAYPYLIDLYKNYVVLYDQGEEQEDEALVERHHQEAIAAITELLQIPAENIITKIRRRQKGADQYEVMETESRDYFNVQEGKLQLEVNLRKYLDTGLFLDHRPLRRELVRTSKGKRLLNLFCYTGALSAAAVVGEAALVTSIDMSATYLRWAERNVRHNKGRPADHEFIQADIIKWLEDKPQGQWDVILLDPPSFSNSKRMDDVLDIQRDHLKLVEGCLDRLASGGRLFFSTNKRKFKIDPVLAEVAKEISHWTVPPDFADTGIHRAWEIRKP